MSLSLTLKIDDPCLYGFSVSPTSVSKSNNSIIDFSYGLNSTHQMWRFERKISKNGQCYGVNGQPTSQCWATWNVLDTNSTLSPFVYGFSGTLNPATGYANWDTGTYSISVRGIGVNNKPSNERSVSFTINN